MFNLLRSIFYAIRQRIQPAKAPLSPGASDVTSPRTVVLVGHCGPDMFMLKTAVGRPIPGASIVFVNDADTLSEYLTSDSLLLVNRELDGQFDTQSGIDLISEVAQQTDGPVTMLISDLEDAQSQAVAAGAKPGFGKSQLYEESTAEILRESMSLR